MGVSFFHVGVPKFLILHPFFRFFARLFLHRGIDFAALRHDILSAWHFNALQYCHAKNFRNRLND